MYVGKSKKDCANFHILCVYVGGVLRSLVYICCIYCKALMYVVLWTTRVYHTCHWSTPPDLTSIYLSSSNTLQEFKLSLIS